MAEYGKVERDVRRAVPVYIVFLVLMAIYYVRSHPTTFGFAITSLSFLAFFTFISLIVTYTGKESKLYGLKPLIDRFPAVKKPDGHVHFRTKMLWVLLVLILYFAMTNVMLYGLDQAKTIDLFSNFRAIMAGAQGSMMHLGIGPIVTGSIIMQLFAGAKIISLDLSDDKDKSIYQGTQKLVVVVMIVVESVPQVYGYLTPDAAMVAGLGANGASIAKLVIIVQLVFGSYMVFLMDEIVSKWGIGSGISLFIAAGVSQAIFTGTINWMPANTGEALSFNNPPAGTIPKSIYLISQMDASQLANGGLETIFLQQPNPAIALIGTIVIFFMVAYIESTKLELPLAHGAARGARGRYPIRLMYASNIPVILMAALLANVSMFAILFWTHPTMSQWPVLGQNWMLGGYFDANNPTQPTTGLAYYLSSVNGVSEWLLPLINPDKYSAFMRGHSYGQVMAHVVVFLGAMIIGSIVFAKFWIETTNMNAEAVAKQIEDSGMQIPGFRRDPRIMRKVLERYIPTVTVISGAAVGALAAMADMIGTVGNASGTGVLLTVGIIIQFYEAMGKEQMMEMHPMLRGFFGE